MSGAEPGVYQGKGSAARAATPGRGNEEDGVRRPEHERDEDVAVAERPRTRKPRLYRVLLHNDDFTTMEFVVEVLMRFFRKDITQARHIMLHVHHKGYGVVDVFPRDVAETKAEQVMDFAKQHGHPLRCTAEPESGEGPEED